MFYFLIFRIAVCKYMRKFFFVSSSRSSSSSSSDPAWFIFGRKNHHLRSCARMKCRKIKSRLALERNFTSDAIEKHLRKSLNAWVDFIERILSLSLSHSSAAVTRSQSFLWLKIPRKSFAMENQSGWVLCFKHFPSFSLCYPAINDWKLSTAMSEKERWSNELFCSLSMMRRFYDSTWGFVLKSLIYNIR